MLGADIVWAYGIGAVGYAIFIASSYFRGRTKPLSLEAVGCTFLALQWWMLGQDMVAAINVFYSYVALCGMFHARYYWVKWLYAMVFPGILLSYILFSDGGVVDLMVILASVPCLAVRYLHDMRIIRGVALTSSALWFFVNLSSNVYAGMICNVGYGIGHLLFFMRKYREGKAVKPLSLNA